MRALSLVSNTENWAEVHNLPEEHDHCPRCGILRIANIPFFTEGFRGLVSEIHDCGENYRLRVFRPINNEITKWRKLSRQV